MLRVLLLAGVLLLDRVVATVEGQPILRSDVVQRSGPWVGELEPGERSDAKRVSKILRDVLDRMIDEVLIEKDAEALQLRVADAEVDASIDQIGRTYSLDRAGVLAEAAKQGMPEAAYRQELRRRLLDARWTSVRTRGKVKPPTTGTEEERQEAWKTLVELERKKMLAQLRAEADVELRW